VNPYSFRYVCSTCTPWWQMGYGTIEEDPWADACGNLQVAP
jgi:hypothetical protein